MVDIRCEESHVVLWPFPLGSDKSVIARRQTPDAGAVHASLSASRRSASHRTVPLDVEVEVAGHLRGAHCPRQCPHAGTHPALPQKRKGHAHHEAGKWGCFQLPASD